MLHKGAKIALKNLRISVKIKKGEKINFL